MLDNINQLYEAGRSVDRLNRRIDELTRPVLKDMSKIPDIYRSLSDDMRNEDCKLRVHYRKVFLMVVILLYSPTALIGRNMRSGLCSRIASVLRCGPTSVSHYAYSILFSYMKVKRFQRDVDHLYGKVISEMSL